MNKNNTKNYNNEEKKTTQCAFLFFREKKKSPFSFGSLTPDLLTVPQTWFWDPLVLAVTLIQFAVLTEGVYLLP